MGTLAGFRLQSVFKVLIFTDAVREGIDASQTSRSWALQASQASLIQPLRAYFERDHAGIVCAYLYGSLARGEGRRESDIDIAVLYTKDPPPTIEGLGVELGDKLERRLDRPIDLLILNRASVDLIHRVLRDGVLVCDRDPSFRIRFEVQARNAYFDLLPYLRQYRRATQGPPS